MKQRNRKRGILKALGIGTLCVGIFSAFGCSRCHSPEKKAEWAVGKISSKLDLTDDQEKKLNAVKDAVLAAYERNKGVKAQKYEKVKTLISSNQLSENAVKDLMNTRRAIIDKEFPKVFPSLQAFHASLTADQKKDAVRLIDKFHKKHSCRR